MKDRDTSLRLVRLGMISLPEYAARHGKDPSSARRMALRGGFETARKVGRDWLINSDEPWPDRRIKTGKYIKRKTPD